LLYCQTLDHQEKKLKTESDYDTDVSVYLNGDDSSRSSQVGLFEGETNNNSVDKGITATDDGTVGAQNQKKGGKFNPSILKIVNFNHVTNPQLEALVLKRCLRRRNGLLRAVTAGPECAEVEMRVALLVSSKPTRKRRDANGTMAIAVIDLLARFFNHLGIDISPFYYVPLPP
jgi:hypothetical protein